MGAFWHIGLPVEIRFEDTSHFTAAKKFIALTQPSGHPNGLTSTLPLSKRFKSIHVRKITQFTPSQMTRDWCNRGWIRSGRSRCEVIQNNTQPS